jgi:thiaminase
LARARFAYYLGQDAAFLDAFCRADALALAKSPDRDGLIAFRERHRQLEQSEGDFRRFASAIHQVACDV